jgi:hypothetical protein
MPEVKCPKCSWVEIYETGRDYVRREVLSWQKDGWPEHCGPVELGGGCYDVDEEYPVQCNRCGYAWNPRDPDGGECMVLLK